MILVYEFAVEERVSQDSSGSLGALVAQDGLYYNFYDFPNNFYEVNNFYILALITTLKVINMESASFKYYVVYFLILKLIFGRM